MKPLLGLLASSQLPDIDPLALARQAIEQAASAGNPKAQVPAAPAAPVSGSLSSGAPRKGEKKFRGWRVFDSVVGGDMTISDAIDRERARVNAPDPQEVLAQRLELVQRAFPEDPKAQIAAMANWEEFGKQISEIYGVDVAAQGSTILRGGEQITAPKFDIVGDRSVMSTANGGQLETQVSAPVPPSFKDVADANAKRFVPLSDGADLADTGAIGANVGPGAPAGDLWSRLIQQESGGNQSAVSPKGAFGRAQLMPDTARYVAGQLGRPELADLARTDPEVNELLGRTYFEEQRQRFGNDAVALAAYNAGPEKAAEWVQRFGMPEPGRELEWAQQITYPETRNYVQSILGGRQAAPAQGAPRIVASNPKDAPREPAGQRFTQENQLRSQFGNRPEVKNLAAVQPHIRMVGSIAEKASRAARGEGPPVTAADDIALVYSFMKILDPTSVVRETEYATAENARGVPEGIRNMFNKARDGTRLTDRQRTEFFQTATTAMDAYTEGYADQAERYRTLAPQYGLNPDNVTGAPRRPKPRDGNSAKPAAKPTASAPRKAGKVRRYNPATGKIE